MSRALACAALAMCFASCRAGDVGLTQSNSNNSATTSTDSNVKRGVKPEPDSQAVVLEVESGGFSYGRIVIELYPNVAPKMVERFKRLVQEGFYNGTAFHRVSASTGVVQGGDPNSKDNDPSNDGLGGSPYDDVPAEFSDIPYERGVVGAARSQDINSANSQFFITLRRVPMWDNKYTVFGRVVEGMDNAQTIAGAPTQPAHPENPADKIIIKSATLQPRSNFK
ncbi:MAG TPA: peptidylprolyl isomerase [Pyrinomonadaceae bacterium]|nr:peptidylprolyl isomerase [Pyrinomonadaceae bacterium]